METINRQQLRTRLESDQPPVLVDVLSTDAFRDYHIAGAINVPLGDSFPGDIRQMVPDKDTPVVVYCKDSDCNASPKAAEQMEGLGYRQVSDYAAGKADWKDAGMPVE